MKNLHKKLNKGLLATIGLNLAILILGVCLLIWAGKVTEIISVFIGLCLIMAAIYYVIDFVSDKHREDADGEISKIIAAVALALAGLFLIVQKTFIQDFISIVVGIALSISGLIGMHRALTFRKYSPENYAKPLVLAIICVICGALCIFGKLVVPELMLQILGVAMIAYAVFSSCGAAMSFKIMQTATPSKEDSAIEAEIVANKDKAKAEEAATYAEEAIKEAEEASRRAEQSAKEARNAKRAARAERNADRKVAKSEARATRAKTKAARAEAKAAKTKAKQSKKSSSKTTADTKANTESKTETKD